MTHRSSVPHEDQLLRRLGDVPPPRAAVVDRARSAVVDAAADQAPQQATSGRHDTRLRPSVRRFVGRRRALPLTAVVATVALIWAVAVSPWSVTREQPDVVATGSGELTQGSSGGSCHQEYSLQALDDADFAFDGVVTAIDSGGLLFGNTVSFAVGRWYRADLGPRTTVAMVAPVDISTTSRDSRQLSTPSYTVGTRLLVAGAFEQPDRPSAESALVWQCGFTRYYDDRTALEWGTTLD